MKIRSLDLEFVDEHDPLEQGPEFYPNVDSVDPEHVPRGPAGSISHSNSLGTEMGRRQQRRFEFVDGNLESERLCQLLLGQRTQRAGRDLLHGELGEANE